MALSDTGSIDIVSESPSGEIVLTIVAPEPWSDVRRTRKELTDKLCTYLEYMHSDEFLERFPGKRASIQLATQDQPPQEVRQLLDATAEAAGIRIDIQHSPWMRVASEPAPERPDTTVRLRDQAVAVPLSAPSSGVSSKRVVQSIFGILGVVIGLGGAIYTFTRSSSFALAIFVFFLANYVVARGVADVITDPHKIRRVLYFALMPAACTGILYVTFQWWGRMWLAVVLGFLGGIILNAILAPLLFPRIHQEEEMDSMERVKAVVERHGTLSIRSER